jgi:genome maintenance exonuclease 1
MNTRFKYREELIYPSLESITSPDGSRVYNTPYGPAPSVTTIISTLSNPGLDEWRERVGEEEAERVSQEARNIGTCMHNMLEAYVRDVPYQKVLTTEENIAKKMFTAVRMMGLRDLQEVWGIEVALHYESLYAGRTDLVGVYSGKRSIIDYKTAKYFKKADWITDYKIQTAAYAIAHDELFPKEPPIEQCVLLIGTRPNPEYRIPPKCQREIIDFSEMDRYKDRWLEVLEEYHSTR